MSILRSPLLIFGILLILAAGALGVGPLLVNWNSYKADFQRQASLLIGRQVTIAGPITVRLFPWPRLTASNVRVANPPGSMLTDLVQIEKVDAEIAAAPLLSGQFSLRKLTLVQPVISLERLAGGGVSWTLKPTHSIAGLPGADQVAVAGIDIIDGRIFFGDGRRGGLSEITGVEGRLKAPALDGPWRADITATKSGSPLALTVSTSKYRTGEPLKVSAAISPRGDSGFQWVFDGETLREDGKVTGRVTVQPARQPNGKANPLNANWQVRMSGDVVADFDVVTLDNIEVVSANDVAGSSLVTGTASVKLGSSFTVTTKLEAAVVDLDQLVGRNLFAELGSGEQLYAVSSLLEALPSNSQIHFDTGITSLITGGETLSRARLSGDISPRAMRIKEASASLPGQTRARFNGVVLPADTDGLPQLAGELEVDSGSLREFVVWAAPDMAESTTQVWSGARGRAKLRTLLGWTPVALRLTGVKAELDDASATGSFNLYLGETPSMSIRLLADSINVDRYAPRGFSTSAIEGGTVAGLTDLAANALAFGDAHVTIQTDSLVLRGVEAQDIAIDVDLSEGAVELRTIEIGGIGDARLDIAGVLNFPDEGIAGSVSGEFKATDPRPFLRLIGMLDAELSSTPWARRLGPVNMKVLSEVSTGGAINKFTIAANGKAAGADIALSGSFDGKFAEWREGDTQITGSATGTTSAGLLALAGLHPLASGDEPARLEIAFSGTPSSGLTGTSKLSLLSAVAGFKGEINIDPAGDVSAAGSLNLESGDITPLARAIGLTVPAWPTEIDREFAATADAVLSTQTLKLSDLNVSLPFNSISGAATIAGDVKSPLIDAELNVKHLDLGWLATGMIMPVGDQPVSAATTFDTSRLGWINRSLSISAQQVAILPGLALTNADASITRANQEAMDFSMTGNVKPDSPFSVSLAARNNGPHLNLSGRLDATLALADLLRAEDGSAAIGGDVGLHLEFEGEGRSPGGLVSQLAGTGRMMSTSLALPKFDLPGMMRRLAEIDDVKQIDATINSALPQGSMTVKTAATDVTLQNGSLRTGSIPISTEFADGTMRLSADFSSNKARADVSLKQHATDNRLPSISMRIAGRPLSLERSYDTSALKSWIVVSVLQRGMDRLEELQRQEQQLIEEERLFREEQAAREAERKRRLLEASEAAARSTDEQPGQQGAEEPADATGSAAPGATAIEQQLLKDLIEQNTLPEIPDEAIINPENSGLSPVQPAQPSDTGTEHPYYLQVR